MRGGGFRATLPRVRYDQLIELCWLNLLPIAVAFIILVPSILVSFDISPLNTSCCFFLASSGKFKKKINLTPYTHYVSLMFFNRAVVISYFIGILVGTVFVLIYYTNVGCYLILGCFVLFSFIGLATYLLIKRIIHIKNNSNKYINSQFAKLFFVADIQNISIAPITILNFVSFYQMNYNINLNIILATFCFILIVLLFLTSETTLNALFKLQQFIILVNNTINEGFNSYWINNSNINSNSNSNGGNNPTGFMNLQYADLARSTFIKHTTLLTNVPGHALNSARLYGRQIFYWGGNHVPLVASIKPQVGQAFALINTKAQSIGNYIVSILDSNIKSVLVGSLPTNNHIVKAKETLILMINNLSEDSILYKFIMEQIKNPFILNATVSGDKLIPNKNNHG